jgi:three-Cys-motif partner protein
VSPKGVKRLEELRAERLAAESEPKRQIKVLAGDFNEKVDEILQSGQITEKTATFSLLDQRAFECEWRTVAALSRHKKTGNKIELFYFFPTGWIDRSIAAVSRPETCAKVERWWGRPDWRELLGMDGLERARLMAARFERELGYKKRKCFRSIASGGEDG